MLEGKKIKTILHLIPTLEGGGAEKQLIILCNELVNRGYDVHVGLRRGGVNLEKLSNRVQVHFLGDYKIIEPRLFFNILKLINKINPDIIQTWLMQMDIVGGLCSIIKKIPWVMTERCSKELYKANIIQSNIRLLLSKKADFVIANSKKGLDYYQNSLDNYKVIKNAIDINTIENTVFSIDTNKKIILAVGRLSYQKNYITLINSIKLLKNNNLIELHIFGEGELRKELIDLVEKSKLSDVVKFNSYNTNWWGLLKQASALVSMSHFEGSPNIVLEAMAGRCPLIVSNIDEHKEILNSKSALFVDVNDSEKLAKFIDNILENKIEVNNMIENAFIDVQGFTVENTVNEYEKIYITRF